MKFKHYLIFTLIATVVSIGITLTINSFNKQNTNYKTAHVKLGDVYEKFELKKQLEVKHEEVETVRKNILDSLEFQLKSLQVKIEETKEKNQSLIRMFQLNRDNYLQKKQQFEEDNQRMTNEYNEQIWNQLNQYIKDYCIENNYSYLFGAEGSGAIMYGADSYDITNEVVEYSNSKFKGN